ncbi:MAG TPA: alpha/beta hydrolase [Chloroflexota bacterium]|jgi:pimeloyl-ACP methyl ester carboxylesterase|nr:alpha/beta hydrolase [Chloroflexota bacterium]
MATPGHTAPHERHCWANGLRLWVREWAGPGRPVVLLHGLASTARIWDLTAPTLALHHRVVAYDQRGHGRSDKPDEPYDFDAVCADLAALLGALALAAPVLVGHSWGGHVALAFAARYPTVPAGLVLVDGGFTDLQARYSWEEAARELAPPDLSGCTPRALLDRLRAGPLGEVLRPSIEAAILANFAVTPNGTLRPWLTRERHLRILRALWELRPTALYPAVRCPVLLLPADRAAEPRGEAFRAARRAAVALAERALPQATTEWFPETAHDIPLHRPAALVAAIRRFVARLPVA